MPLKTTPKKIGSLPPYLSYPVWQGGCMKTASHATDLGMGQRALRGGPTSAPAECHLKSIDLKSTLAFTTEMPKRNGSIVAFGRNVRKRREDRNLTQEALAERAELDRTYISDVERGARNLSILSILRIAKALGTTASELSRGIEK